MSLTKIDRETIVFILLIIILLINPDLIYNLNKSFIGQIMLLIVIIYFSCHNLVLGLLTILLYFIILDKYRYIIEGMIGEQQITTNNTIGEIDNEQTKVKESDENKMSENDKKNKIIISTNNVNSNGIDIQDIRDSISSKDSNSFPLSKNMFKSSDDVEPFNIR